MDRVLSMIGIAAKSGNVVSGEFSTEKAVKTGSAFAGSMTEVSFSVTPETIDSNSPIFFCAVVATVSG